MEVSRMHTWHGLLYLGVLLMVAVGNEMLDECLKSNRKYTMNVVLLEDNTFEWSEPLVREAVTQAIEKDTMENNKYGMKHDWMGLTRNTS